MKEKKQEQQKLPLSESTVAKQEVVAKEKELSVPNRFIETMHRYTESVLPHLLKKHFLDINQFLQIVSSEFKRNKRLQDAFIQNPASLFASILSGAEIGLVPSELLGEFYLIPRKIDGRETITPLIGYKGLIKILMRGSNVTKIHANCVFEGDEFFVEYGLEPKIKHIPKMDGEKNSNKLKYVYVVAKLSSGDFQFVVMSKSEILKIKAMSKYNNELYLNDNKDPQMWMVKKTALIQLAKLLPKDYYGTKAVELDGKLEGGALLDLDEDHQVKIIDGKKVSVVKQANVMNTFAALPDLDEANNQ
jgi:recombination protein RecT